MCIIELMLPMIVEKNFLENLKIICPACYKKMKKLIKLKEEREKI